MLILTQTFVRTLTKHAPSWIAHREVPRHCFVYVSRKSVSNSVFPAKTSMMTLVFSSQEVSTLAFDLVRVIGNNAVHPCALDLKDDRETAAKLFVLVNRIADDMISHPKQLDALYYEKLSEGEKKQITKRDAGNISS